MKCSRTLYRIAVSALPTDGTDAGLLPTVQTQGLKKCEKGKTVFMPVNLLPTPTANDAKNSTMPPSEIGRDSLVGTLMRGTLPTPKANDYRSGMANRIGTNHTQQLNDTIAYRAGKTSLLNPLFVEEMMGFPVDWLVSPFLRGAENRSKPAETP